MKSYSFLFLFILCSSIGFAYTVVLNNGKHIEGSLILDDESKIVLKDSKGATLTFKKSSINVDETKSLNLSTPTNSVKSDSSIAATPQSKPTSAKGVADIARESRNKSHGNAKVLSQDDVDSLPELAHIESDSPAEVNEVTEDSSQSSASQDPPKISAPLNPNYRDELFNRLAMEEKKHDSLVEQCQKQGNSDPKGGVGQILGMKYGDGSAAPPTDGLGGACAQAEASQRMIDYLEEQLTMARR